MIIISLDILIITSSLLKFIIRYSPIHQALMQTLYVDDKTYDSSIWDIIFYWIYPFFSSLLYFSFYFVPENFYSLMDTLSSLLPRCTWNPADLPSSHIPSLSYCFNTLTPRNLTPDHITIPDHNLTTEHDLTSGSPSIHQINTDHA